MGNKIISVFVDADLEIRFQRYLKTNITDFETFLEMDNHLVELETESLKPLCDFILDSNSTFSTSFQKTIIKIQEKIGIN